MTIAGPALAARAGGAAAGHETYLCEGGHDVDTKHNYHAFVLMENGVSRSLKPCRRCGVMVGVKLGD